MIANYNRRSLVFGVPGIVLQIAGNIAARVSQDSAVARIGGLAMLAGTGLLLVGLAFYAKAKGRHPAWCLLAFLTIIGVLVLALLKDRATSGDAADAGGSVAQMDNNRRHSPIIRFGLGFFGFIFIMSGALSGYVHARKFLEARASANWPSVPGTLTRAQVGEHGGGRYFADVAYTYHVGANEFVGSNVRGVGGGNYNIRDGAVQEIRGLIAGQPVTVYYEPSNPGKATLRPGAGFQDYAILVVCAVMFGIGAWAFSFLFRRRPVRRD